MHVKIKTKHDERYTLYKYYEKKKNQEVQHAVLVLHSVHSSVLPHAQTACYFTLRNSHDN